MNFKAFVEKEYSVKCPYKECKANLTISLKEYHETLKYINPYFSKSKKDLHLSIENSESIPVLCKEHYKFFMLELKTGNVREVKSRDEKTICGTVFNGILNESKLLRKTELHKKLTEDFKFGWDPPTDVYKILEEKYLSKEIKKIVDDIKQTKF